jgi:hypothetical protein
LFSPIQKRRTTVKRIVNVLFALAVLIATASTGHAQNACSNATLSANYAFTDSGFAAPHPTVRGPEVPIVVVGVLRFDGAGNASLSFTLAINGGISPSQSDTGTYTVNSDCTGSISFTAGDAPIDFNIVIIGGGTEVFGIVTSDGNTQTFDAKKQ